MRKIGFIVNPYAGAGGRIGLKGSDNIKVENPEIPLRIERFLKKLDNRREDIQFITPRFKMGEIYLINQGLNYSRIEIGSKIPTTRNDTINAVKLIKNFNIDLLLFVGGDGTARDIMEGLGSEELPVLGIPAGVKMYSGVFANNPEAAAIIVNEFLRGKTRIIKAEVLDVDEETLRKGKIELKLYGYLNTITFGNFLTPTKQEIESSIENLDEIAEFVIERIIDIDKDSYFVFGPGSTVKYILSKLGYKVNYISINVLKDKKMIIEDANYYDLIKLDNIKIILSPIGKQGFLLGRGNQEIGPEVLRKIAKDDIIVVSTIEKMYSIECLRIDTGDPMLDLKFSGSYKVIVGYEKFYGIRSCH